MNFDSVFDEIGHFGRYQKFVVFLTLLNGPPIAFLFLNSVFVLSVPDHRCAIPGYPNDTYAVQSEYHQHLINRTIPNDDFCHVFPADVYYGPDNKPINASKVSCDSWIYDDSVFESTLAAKLNLVCDRKIYKSNAQMIFFGGVLTGSFLTGLYSDRFGRRVTCCHFTVLLIGAGLAVAWTPNYVFYVVFMFLIGLFAVGNFMPLFVIGMEFVGPPKRKHAGMLGAYSWNVGLLLLALMGYMIRDWYYLQLASALPGVIMLIYWWLLPESPRWLMSRGRYDDAEKITQKIAKYNGTKLPEGFFKKIRENMTEEPKGQIWEMFKTKRLAVRTIIIFVNWIVVCMTYYGLTLNSGNLGGDMFLNFTLNVLADLPASLMTHFLLDRTGRKPYLVGCMVLGGAMCLATMFTVKFGGEDLQILTKVLAVLGKIGASAGFSTAYIYSAELYPTVVRNAGMGSSSCMARIGGMVAPYVADLGNLVDSGLGKGLPMLVFGGLSVFAGLLALNLPETLNKNLPETIEDADNFGRKSSFKGTEVTIENGKINEAFDGMSQSNGDLPENTKL